MGWNKNNNEYTAAAGNKFNTWVNVLLISVWETCIKPVLFNENGLTVNIMKERINHSCTARVWNTILVLDYVIYFSS